MRFSDKFIKANDNMCSFDEHIPAPYFRKKFSLDFVPQKAEITICGLGFYELYINGKEITKGPLAPYINNTNEICYYDNYDITDMLSKGENVIGILLGNGFRNCFGGFVWKFDKAKSRGPVITALAFEAVGEGEEQSLKFEADTTFKTHPSPIIFDDLRMGYRYDSRLEIPNWNLASFDDSEWENAKTAMQPAGEARLCRAEPITVTEKIKPVSIKHYDELPFAYENSSQKAKEMPETIRKNVYVFDFGVNSAGVTVLKINGLEGQQISIRHAEHTVRGNFSMNTTMFKREDKTVAERYLEYGQRDIFICKGGEETFIPKFKYDGFRYAYVEGLLPEQVNEDTLTYYIMNSDIKSRAGFNSSNEILNRLQECTRRSDLSNFYYFPTDCPHREKNGWTGDAAVSAEHMLLNLKASNSLKVWCECIAAAQRTDGTLPGIVPTGGWSYRQFGPSWDGVCVDLPYFIYKYDGDISVIKENASLILRYFHYIMSRRNERGLIEVGLGDWCDPFRAVNGKIAAPLEVTDSITIYDIAVKATHLFGIANMDYAKQFTKQISKDMREAIRKHLIDFNTMTVDGDCQTAQAFAIEAGIFNDDEIEFAGKRLVDIVHRDEDENHCGMIGLRYIFHALTRIGESELAYKMVVSKNRTGYGRWISEGATTLREKFVDIESGAASLNHHFFGDVSSWMIQEIAGIKPNPHVNDVSYFEISPHFITNLDFAEAYFESANGIVKSRWQREKENIVLSVEIPENIHGKIIINDKYVINGEKVLSLTGGKTNYLIEKRE